MSTRQLSWQTLWAGPLLADGIRGATTQSKESPSSEEAAKDVSDCLPEMLEANAGLWEGRRGYLYADSASSAGKCLELIEGQFEAWSAEERTCWKDGTGHVARYASFH